MMKKYTLHGINEHHCESMLCNYYLILPCHSRIYSLNQILNPSIIWVGTNGLLSYM